MLLYSSGILSFHDHIFLQQSSINYWQHIRRWDFFLHLSTVGNGFEEAVKIDICVIEDGLCTLLIQEDKVNFCHLVESNFLTTSQRQG